MNDDKRKGETLSLRTFFDEQIQHLHALLDNLGQSHEQPLTDEDRKMLESFVDAANSRIRIVHGYAEQLREHVRSLHAHVLRIYQQIPPPREVSHYTFKTDALLNALFVNVHDIDRLFNAGAPMEGYLRSRSKYQVPVLYALLTAGKSEKSTLGVGMMGDMLVRDVPQQTVNFSGHKLHLPCASEDELSVALKHHLFDRVVTLIKQEMAVRVAGETLRPSDKSYQSRLGSLANPSVYLTTLVEYLVPVTSFLNIERTHFKLNKLGVKLDEHDSQCANEFDIDELIWRDNSRHLVLQVAYRR